jgi:shikimate kinase
MGRTFIDLDLELTAEFGQSITDFVRLNGWERFRRREEALVVRVAGLKDHVIATGGGVVGTEANVSLMRADGWVVWLKARPDTLKQRLRADGNTSDQRPSIGHTADPVSELESLLQTRQAAYQRAMHVAVETDERSLESICRRIMDEYHCR